MCIQFSADMKTQTSYVKHQTKTTVGNNRAGLDWNQCLVVKVSTVCFEVYGPINSTIS